MSVSAHLLGYGLNSTDLFRGAILESGGPTTVRILPRSVLLRSN